MKPKNMPLRKLERKARAEGFEITPADKIAARTKRTKKNRSDRAKLFR